MQWFRNLVQGAVTLLVATGSFVAVVNLPMFTGCDFYAHCAAPTQQAALPKALAAKSTEK